MAGSGDRVAERHYEPLWKLIRLKKKAVISLTPAWHKRVKKAVCKEKHMDYGYKLECDDRGSRAEISFASNGAQLTITLTEIKLLRLENL